MFTVAMLTGPFTAEPLNPGTVPPLLQAASRTIDSTVAPIPNSAALFISIAFFITCTPLCLGALRKGLMQYIKLYTERGDGRPKSFHTPHARRLNLLVLAKERATLINIVLVNIDFHDFKTIGCIPTFEGGIYLKRLLPIRKG
jgi:hypothetical protein